MHVGPRWPTDYVFMSLFLEQNIMEMWFRYYNEIVDVMTCFDVMTNPLTSWRVFDVMTNLVTS